jgi:carbamoylphosphate synthase large subunit
MASQYAKDQIPGFVNAIKNVAIVGVRIPHQRLLVSCSNANILQGHRINRQSLHRAPSQYWKANRDRHHPRG